MNLIITPISRNLFTTLLYLLLITYSLTYLLVYLLICMHACIRTYMHLQHFTPAICLIFHTYSRPTYLPTYLPT